MRLLADESCDFAVVRALRAADHDVVAVAELARGLDDAAVLELAVTQRRLLLTEDKDFGQWVFAEKRASAGVVLLRYSARARREILTGVVQLVNRRGDALAGSFVVMQPGRVRIRRPQEHR